METLKSNKLIIMFVLLMILMIMLAWWVADRLIQRIDQHILHF